MVSGDYAVGPPKFSVDNALKDANHIKDIGTHNGVSLHVVDEAIRLLKIVKEEVGEKGDLPGMYGAKRTEIGLPYAKESEFNKD